MGDLLVSYDEGISSTGWSVWKTDSFEPTLLAAGDVDYPTDDCLASKRRQLCHLRRSIRSRKQCIAQLAKLFVYLKLLPGEKIKVNRAQSRDFKSHPWFLAARVLATFGLPEKERSAHLLAPAQLWDVLRWYAHNRGYYIPWAGYSDESDEDTRKVAAARALMNLHGKKTMAETCCASVGITDPLNPPSSIAGSFVGEEFKGKHNGKQVREVPSFPRDEILVPEVTRILEAHKETLGKHACFAKYPYEQFVEAIVADWKAIPDGLRLPSADKNSRKRSPEQKQKDKESKIWLPKRYQGGLLFGQRIPRFQNRIISNCRRTGKKTPLKQCREFYDFRWAMFVANIKVGDSPKDRRPLNKKHRAELNARMQSTGFLTRKGLESAVKEITGFQHNNMKETFADTPESEDALVVQPVERLLASKDRLEHYLFPTLPDKLQKKLRNALWRGKRIKVGRILGLIKGNIEAERKFEKAIQEYICARTEPEGREMGNDDDATSLVTDQTGDETDAKREKRHKAKLPTRKELLESSLFIAPLSGRAPYCREILKQACREVFGLNDDDEPSDNRPATDPRKYSREQLRQEGKAAPARLANAEDKPRHGCLAGVEEITAETLGIARDENQRETEYQAWRTVWIARLNKKGEDLNRRRAETYGEAWVRRQYETRKLEKWLAGKSNNHLVRQRMLILDRLTQDIIADPALCNGDPKRIGRVAIEVARDLVTFSGMTSKQRGGDDKGVMGQIRAQHRRVSKWLRQQLGRPYEHLINGYTIKLAKIAEDLDFRDPYLATHPRFDPLKLARREYQVDHIVPKSVRLTDAMEAVVLTTPEINKRKGKMTSLQFIREMNKPENIAERDRFGICSVQSYLDFVESLKTHQTKPSGNGKAEDDLGDDGDGKSSDKINPKYLPGSQRLHPDYKRRKLRKRFLLVPEYTRDNDGFTSRQLTNTSYLNRLAQSVVLRRLPHLTEENVASIPGQVTKALRDSGGWSLYSCLGHTDVCGNAATREVPRFDKSTRLPLKDNNGDPIVKRVPIPKEDLRKLTHLHHAVDACALGLIAHWLPKHGKLWELLALGELTEAEKQQYESLVKQFAGGELEGGQTVNRCDLEKFLTCYKIDDAKTKRSPDPDRVYRLEARRTPDAKARMCRIRDQISRALAKKRVVQHIPSEQSGLPTDETVYRVVTGREGKGTIARLVRAKIEEQRGKTETAEKALREIEAKLATFDERVRLITDKQQRAAAKKDRKPLANERDDRRSKYDSAKSALAAMEDFKSFVWIIKYVRADSQTGKEIQKRLAKTVQHSSNDGAEDTNAPALADDGEENQKTKKPPKFLRAPVVGKDKLFITYEICHRSKLIGPSPTAHNGSPKLKPLKAAKEINDNYGVAFLDQPIQGQDRWVLIPWHKIRVRLYKDLHLDGGKSLVQRNSGRMPKTILRKGDTIGIDEGVERRRYRIFGFGHRPGRGIFFNFAGCDETKRRKPELTPAQLEAANFCKLSLTLTGAERKACPSTSSA